MTLVTCLMLLAALFHAGWHAFIKSTDDRVAGLVTINLLSMSVGLAAVSLVPFPNRASWGLLAVSTAVHLLYKLLLPVAYAAGDLTQIYPIIRGVAPLAVAVVGAMALGQAMSPAELAGVALISTGVLSLSKERCHSQKLSARALLVAVVTGLIIAAYTLIDGYGTRQEPGPFSYAAWLFVFDGAVFVLTMWWWRGPRLWSEVRKRWRGGVGSGLIAIASYGVFLWALSLGAMGAIAALRETTVLFAALLGSAFLGERLGKMRIAAALTITSGVILIATYS